MILKYTLSFPNPTSHYVMATMEISDHNGGEIQLYMPVWTPGSYLVREYAKNIVAWSCNFTTEKENKNTWKINSQKGISVIFQYKVYAYDLTVRTSYVDEEQAYLNGANIFMAISGFEHLPAIINIHPDKEWPIISTTLLTGKDKWQREASSFHELVDSPILLGNHEILTFDIAGIEHTVAMVGSSNMVKKTFQSDLQKICQLEADLFREHPSKSYLFIIHHTDNKRGGLEHKNSSSNFIPSWDYIKGEKYNDSLSLLAHEYFHLWNVKRIRPIELSEYDYKKEQYTRQLWVAEGITSYYDDYITYKAGIETRKEYLKIVADNISRVVNRPGDQVQSLAEASFDTWIKYYRPDENSTNSQVHYYHKGAAITIALNCLILHHTVGKCSLDDVMRELYQLWKKHPEKGYTEQQVLEVFEKISQASLKTFFEEHIYGTVPIDYNQYFNLIGLELEDVSKDNPFIGWGLNKKDNTFLVSQIFPNSGAADAGIYVHDEILAIDGYRMTDEYEKFYAHKKSGDMIDIVLSRQGVLKQKTIPLQKNPNSTYTLQVWNEAPAKAKRLTEIWLTR